MKKFLTLFACAMLMFMTGCARIASGEVGLRVDVNNVVQPGELMPGSWNQTIVGSVLEFPVRDVPLVINDAHPLTADKTALKDFDLTAAYSISPTCVSDLWSKKSRTFHGTTEHGEYLLMQNFVQNTLNSAAYKAVAKYNALDVSGQRDAIQADIHTMTVSEMKDAGYEGCLAVNSIQVKSIVPSDAVLASAQQVVSKANELKAKQMDVQIAEQEAKRMEAVSASGSNLAYMQVESQRLIAQAIHEGKVNTIIVPLDFKGQVVVPSK
jgi:hypothetical protein